MRSARIIALTLLLCVILPAMTSGCAELNGLMDLFIESGEVSSEHSIELTVRDTTSVGEEGCSVITARTDIPAGTMIVKSNIEDILQYTIVPASNRTDDTFYDIDDIMYLIALSDIRAGDVVQKEQMGQVYINPNVPGLQNN